MALATPITSSLQYDHKEEENEKKKLLNVTELSDVEKRYSLSALRILHSRYLLKNDKGEVVERPDDLFKRVAVAAGIMEVLYDPLFYTKERGAYLDRYYYVITRIEQEKMQVHLKNIDYASINKTPGNIDLEEFVINLYHQDRLMARYIELAKEGRMKVNYADITSCLKFDDQIRTKYHKVIKEYYDLMCAGIFLPNTPALMNAGTKLNQNAACFTLRMKDDLEHIYKTYGDIARIFKSGGGIGINYSELRPEGAYVKGTGGASSGTLSWLKGTDETTGRVAQGGKRRGAAMGILNWTHPEIERFITLKDNKTLHNHNISVCTTDSFFVEGLFKDSDREKHLMRKIVRNAWNTGDPGMVFLENMNSNNLLKDIFDKDIDVTNPCSEISMYPYESCILASINLAKFINPETKKFAIEPFIQTTKIVTRFLDNIIDATNYPLPEINQMTKDCRRIGVGYMGLADAMIKLGITYNSKQGFMFTEFVTALMTMASLLESKQMADIKGAFPLWYHRKYPKHKLPVNAIIKGDTHILEKGIEMVSDYFSYEYLQGKDIYKIIEQLLEMVEEGGGKELRNCSVTTVAPTGTLSMLADCSSGIEPLFSLGFVKKVTIGDFVYVNKDFEEALKKENKEYKHYIDDIIKNHNGVIPADYWLSDTIKNTFVTAMEIHPFDHLMMQAVAQRWITNGISKTINAPTDIDERMILYCYTLAWALGAKGTTIYRDGCKPEQVLNNSSIDKNKKSNLKASGYTTEVIASLENIPLNYKNALVDACHNDLSIIETYSASLLTDRETDPVFLQSIKKECTNCNSINTLQRNGACHICIACGSQIGSCS